MEALFIYFATNSGAFRDLAPLLSSSSLQFPRMTDAGSWVSETTLRLGDLVNAKKASEVQLAW